MNMLYEIVHQKQNIRDAAIITEDAREISYAELWNRIVRLSDHLRRTVGTKKAVAIQLRNSEWFVISYFAVIYSGNCAVPIQTQAPELEVKRVIDECDVSALLTETVPKHPEWFQCSICAVDSCRLCSQRSPGPDVITSPYDENSLAVMIATSGTTSNPKAVMLSHKNILSNAKALVHELGIQPGDRTLMILPMSLSSGHIQMISHLLGGGTLVFAKDVLRSGLPQILKERHISDFSCTPMILKTFLNRVPMDVDLPELKRVGSGGAPVPASLLSEAVSRFPDTTFIQYYGQTEASPRITHCIMKGAMPHPGSVGTTLDSVRVRIVDENDTECPVGTEGELIVKGPNIMLGYYHNEAATNAALRNGWLHTGDIAWRDNTGNVYISGRKRNVINSGGVNVHPEEVEEVINDFPGVVESLVYGDAHPVYQEVPKAYIVAEHSISIEELRRYCLARLQAVKVPVKFELRESLPKTATGKIVRGKGDIDERIHS